MSARPERRPRRRFLAEIEPSLDRIKRALDEDAAGLPVTQRTVDADEPIVITKDYLAGSIYVSAGNRVLMRFKLQPDPTKPRHVSTHVDFLKRRESDDPAAPSGQEEADAAGQARPANPR